MTARNGHLLGVVPLVRGRAWPLPDDTHAAAKSRSDVEVKGFTPRGLRPGSAARVEAPAIICRAKKSV